MFQGNKAQAAVFAVICSVGTAVGFAQSTSSALVGVVRDTTGAVLPNSAITATNTATGVSYQGVSNSNGEYRISNLPFGSYTVETKHDGFAVSALKDVNVTANNVETADITLSTATQNTTVEVSSEASVALDTTTAQISSTFTSQELQDLPTATIGLGALNLSLLAPGVTSTGGLGAGTGPSISGQRPRNNNFEIDGMDNNSKSVTGPELYVPNDAVSEFVLLQNIYSAEYGHSAGGQFNSLIVSGTNGVHGRVYEYAQNRNLNAVDASQARNNPATNPGFKPRYDFNRYGGQIGGPILKNRLFGFTNFERQTTGQSASPSTFCAPTAAGFTTLDGLAFASSQNLKVYQQYSPVAATAGTNGCGDTKTQSIFVSPNGGPTVAIPVGGVSVPISAFSNFDYSTSSMDYTLSTHDTLRGRYVYNRQDGQDTAATFPVFFNASPNRFHLATIDETHTFSPNLSNDFRIGYNRYFNETAVPAATFPGLSVFPNLIFDDLKSVNLGPDPNGPQSTIQNLYDATESLTWVKGKQTINVGVEGRKYIAPQVFVQRLRGDYDYSTLNLYLNDLSPDELGQRNATPPGVSPTFYGDQTSIYAWGNDDYRLLPTLTLNLGLRYEFTSVPFSEKEQSLNQAASVPGLISFSKPTPQYKNFAPRIGINYAPNENTSIRAAFGINYDVLYDNIGTTTAPPQFQTTENVNLQAQTPGFLAGGGLPANTTFSTLAGQRAATSAYVPNQKLPYSEQWTLGVQHVFGKNYTAEVRYVGTRGVHLDVQEQIDVHSPVTTANQLPTNLTGGGVALNGAQTLAALEAPVSGVPYNKVAAFYNAGLTSTITSDEPFGGSNYNGLQTQLTRRFQRGLLLNASYTYSRAFDDSTADFNTTALNPRRPQDSQNLRAEYSRSDLDRPHRLTVEMIYDLPYFKNRNFIEKNLLGNWEVTPIYTFQSPQYTTVQSGVDSNLNGDSAGDRVFINPSGKKGTGSNVVALVNPTIACAKATGSGVANGTTAVVPDCAANIVGYTAGSVSGSSPNQVFTPNTTAYYVVGGVGTSPSAGRNTLPTGRENNFDMNLLKRISYRERYKIELGAQAFNVLNHSQYLPGSLNQVNSLGSTQYRAFDEPSSSAFNQKQLVFSNNARSMQLSGKIIF